MKALLGLAILLVGGIVVWEYRPQIAGAYRSLAQDRSASVKRDSVLPPSVGRPSAKALASARKKEAAMAREGGPAYVVLSADEMASLIDAGLNPAAQEALDSLEVTLHPDRFSLRAQLITEVLGATLLGALAAILEKREPLSVSGPARVARQGVVAWEPDSFALRAFPFPRSAIPLLINKLIGGSDGVIPLSVPKTVGDIRIRMDGVTFYRGAR